MSKTEEALAFATKAHGDQKYGDAPYTAHLQAVYRAAMELGAPQDVLVAAYLHDVVEDTAVELSEIDDRFGSRIGYLVWAVTNEPGINRKERNAKTYPKTRGAGTDAVLLKLCDRIANVRASAGQGNAGKMGMYRKEHAAFRLALHREGEHVDAWRILDGLMAGREPDPYGHAERQRAMFGDASEWAAASSAHGSKYRYDGPDPFRPPLPLKTFHEAWRDADHWIGHADTVGGHALVVHVTTGECYDVRERYVGHVSRYVGPEPREERDVG